MAHEAKDRDVNRFFPFPGLTRFGDTWVVSVNNDTVYSVAVVDAREGFTVEVPEMGDRFVSLHVQDLNHTFVGYSLQPRAGIVAVSAIPFEPQHDPAITARVREARLPQYERLPDTYGTVRYDIRAVTDWEKWTYAVAGQFGLSPECGTRPGGTGGR
jgi:hypothetical protein